MIPLSELTYIAISLGLVLSLAFSEIFGLAAGGMIVPGYIALDLHHPLRIIGTVIVAFAVLGAIRLISKMIFLYGRRRFVLTILIGFFFGWLADKYFIISLPTGETLDAAAIGYIIPGLIANWMERQGIIQTLCVMLMGSVLVRLMVNIIIGGTILS